MRIRAGAVQLNATEDTQANLKKADQLVREAASLGAELVVLPEKWTVLGTPEQMAAGAETLVAVELVQPVRVGEVLLTHGGVAIGRVVVSEAGSEPRKGNHEVRQ